VLGSKPAEAEDERLRRDVECLDIVKRGSEQLGRNRHLAPSPTFGSLISLGSRRAFLALSFGYTSVVAEMAVELRDGVSCSVRVRWKVMVTEELSKGHPCALWITEACALNPAHLSARGFELVPPYWPSRRRRSLAGARRRPALTCTLCVSLAGERVVNG
jgi:hypothetical protein